MKKENYVYIWFVLGIIGSVLTFVIDFRFLPVMLSGYAFMILSYWDWREHATIT
uniref:ORF31 n=1 Tax=Nitrosopumilaceae spindle-shaped virus TaxID=3065433 RepID=A0AAT9J7M2_9VIRU